MMPMDFLGVVGAMSKCHEGGGDDLEPAKVPADDAGGEMAEEVQDELHEQIPENDPAYGGEEKRQEYLYNAADIQER